MDTEKKEADPHKDCPTPVWAGVEWLCMNHLPPQVVVIQREAYVAPSRGPSGVARPRPVAPVPRPVRDTDLHTEVDALTVKLAATTDALTSLIADVAKLRATMEAFAATKATKAKAS